MSRLSDAFSKRKALIIFLTAGDPSLIKTEQLIYDFEKAGADIIELGIPFSDPLADGPIIQASHQRALKKNVSLKNVFLLVKKVRSKSKIPIVFMLSDNLIEKIGAEKFYAQCEQNDIDGVIVPDLSYEEAQTQVKAKVDKIFLVAPTTSEERIKQIADASAGFVYLISTTGVTGKREKLSEEVTLLAEKVKKYTNKPVAVGFGISTAEQASQAAQFADGVIVGSAVVDLIGRKKFKQAKDFVLKVRKKLDD